MSVSHKARQHTARAVDASTRPTVPSETTTHGEPGNLFITSAITSRPGLNWENVEQARGPVAPRTGHSFASADECREAAGRVAPWSWDGHEGPVDMLEVGPGIIRLATRDLNRREQALNRAAERPVVAPGEVDEETAEYLAELAEQSDGETGTRGVIKGWSARSRARMVAVLAELDLAPLVEAGPLAMPTLTYPGKWEQVAPNRATVNKHLETLRKRRARAFPQIKAELWKFEFQRRGAPHIHMAHVIPGEVAYAEELAKHETRVLAWELGGKQGPPPYRKPALGEGLPFGEWLALNWVDIVNHPDAEERRNHYLVHAHPATLGLDEGARARDPKRLAVYFGKHGQFKAKDYQNEVPELWLEGEQSVGRFWGYRGLSKALGKSTLPADGEKVFMARVLARYAQQVRMINPVTGEKVTRLAVKREQRVRARERIGDDGVLEVRYTKRWTTTRVKRMNGPRRSGFLVVNDGPAVARELARALEVCVRAEPPAVLPVGMRGPVWSRREVVDGGAVRGPGQPAPAGAGVVVDALREQRERQLRLM